MPVLFNFNMEYPIVLCVHNRVTKTDEIPLFSKSYFSVIKCAVHFSAQHTLSHLQAVVAITYRGKAIMATYNSKTMEQSPS